MRSYITIVSFTVSRSHLMGVEATSLVGGEKGAEGGGGREEPKTTHLSVSGV